MATTQQMLSAITGMQENAQAALPVIPNNGNPAGANNMPQQQQAPSPGPAAPPALPWLAPSASMQLFQQQLAARQTVLAQQRMPATQQAPVAQAPQAVVPVQQAVVPQQPVLPQAGAQPILPQRQRIS